MGNVLVTLAAGICTDPPKDRIERLRKRQVRLDALAEKHRSYLEKILEEAADEEAADEENKVAALNESCAPPSVLVPEGGDFQRSETECLWSLRLQSPHT